MWMSPESNVTAISSIAFKKHIFIRKQLMLCQVKMEIHVWLVFSADYKREHNPIDRQYERKSSWASMTIWRRRSWSAFITDSDGQNFLLISMPKEILEMEQIVPFADMAINFSLSCYRSSLHQLANPRLLTELILKLPMSMRIGYSYFSN